MALLSFGALLGDFQPQKPLQWLFFVAALITTAPIIYITGPLVALVGVLFGVAGVGNIPGGFAIVLALTAALYITGGYWIGRLAERLHTTKTTQQ